MSRKVKTSNFASQPKKSQFKRWNSRFSAGGANRTNVHDQIQRLNQRDESEERFRYLPLRSSRLPYDRYDYREDEEREDAAEFSPSNFRDGRGRPMQRMGLFRNAKHSDVVMPAVDEQLIRNTEATIRKLTRPERHSSRYDVHDNNSVRNRVRQVVYEMGIPDGYRVYDGVAEVRGHHSARPEGYSRRRLFSPPVKRYSNPRQNVLYDSGYEPRTSERKSSRAPPCYRPRIPSFQSREGPSTSQKSYYQEHDYDDEYYEEERDEEVEEEGRNHEEEQMKRRRHEHNIRFRNPNDSSDSIEKRRRKHKSPRRQNSSPPPHIPENNNPKCSKRKSPNIQAGRRRVSNQDVSNQNDPDSPSDNRVEKNRKSHPPSKNNSYVAYQSPIQKKTDSQETNVRPSSRSSCISSTTGRKLLLYQKDGDNDADDWRKGIVLMTDPNGEGAAIVERIGSSMPNLPLTDNSEKCYSKIAFLLIGRSMKDTMERENGEQGFKKKKGEHERAQNKVFNKLRNMSISWAAASTILAGGGDFPSQRDNARNQEPAKSGRSYEVGRGSIMNDISKIRNPQSLLANGFGMDESVFANSRFLRTEVLRRKERREVNGERSTAKHKTGKCSMAPPMFHSSPVSNDVVKSDEMFTIPSSIHARKNTGSNIMPAFLNDSDSDPEVEKEMSNYIDIEKGATQLTYIHTPEVRSSQSVQTFNFGNVGVDSPEEIVQNTDESLISRSNLFRQKTDNDAEIDELLQSPIADVNDDPFNFTTSNHEQLKPMLDADATTRRLFDNAYEEYQEQRRSKRSSRDPSNSRFLF